MLPQLSVGNSVKQKEKEKNLKIMKIIENKSHSQVNLQVRLILCMGVFSFLMWLTWLKGKDKG